MSTKNVSTKIALSERINIRCSKAFKAQLEELCVQNGMSITNYITSLCKYEISKSDSHKESTEVITGRVLNYKLDRDKIVAIASAWKEQGNTYKVISEKLNEYPSLTFGLTKWNPNAVAGIFRYKS